MSEGIFDQGLQASVQVGGDLLPELQGVGETQGLKIHVRRNWVSSSPSMMAEHDGVSTGVFGGGAEEFSELHYIGAGSFGLATGVRLRRPGTIDHVSTKSSRVVGSRAESD